MKAKTITTLAYPPPPPPPPQASSKMDSRKLLVVVLLIVIVVVSAGVLVYLMMNQSSSTNPTPNPSATPTASPSGTSTPSPSATPSGTGTTANFRTGWATYVIKSYDAGEVTAENTMKYAISEGTYSGTACWVMTVEMTMNQESGTMKIVMTYWISKSTGQGIHMKTQTYMNGELANEYEEDIEPGEDGDIPEPIDISTVTSTETITVPAGTFTCAKITATTSGGTSTAWYNSNIPVIGLVKTEVTSAGSLVSTTELTGYGQ
ncbi:MAG: hypothetical protein NWE94_03590 [Candidatus Bathyarchaeota archaeon]|nr:hypothetical protein [Candidatus Bathyarchaeota archaeon]